jgi:hypothetical protein
MKPTMKISILLLTSILLIGCLAGCTPGQTPQTATPSATPTQPEPTQPAPTQATEPIATSISGPLPTAIPNDFGLTIEENEVIGDVRLDPLSFDPVHGSEETILERHEDEKGKVYQRDNVVEIDENNILEARTYFAAADDGVVMLQQNGETIFEADVGDGSPMDPFQGLWVEDGHWILEVAYVTVTSQDNNNYYTNAVGQVYRDGVSLNEQYSYEEMFGYQPLGGKPFYFYQQDGVIHLSYDGQELPLWYDEVPHYGCCSYGMINPRAASNWVSFWGQREGVWYYTEIGLY